MQNIIKILSSLTLSAFLLLTCNKDTKNDIQTPPANTFTISQTGGAYAIDGGIEFTVPPGAVAENTTINARKLVTGDIEAIYAEYDKSADSCLGGFISEEDIAFSIPVTVRIQADITGGELVMIHDFDPVTGDYTPHASDITLLPDEGIIEFTVSHFSGKTVEQIAEDHRGDEYCTTYSCRCGEVSIIQTDNDNVCQNGGCQVVSTTLRTTFLSCPDQPVDEDTITEISPGCSPEIMITPASPSVKTGENTTVTANLSLPCNMEKEGYSIAFSYGFNGSVSPGSADTDADGGASAVFTAGDMPGAATVTATATVSYYSYTNTVSSGGETETINGPLVTRTLLASVDIDITDETEQPHVVSVNPADGATGVAVDTAVTVLFSEDMDKTSAEGAFSISPIVTGTFSWSDDKTMTFTPATNLSLNTGYAVSISTDAKSSEAQNLTGACNASFISTITEMVSVPGQTYLIGKYEVTYELWNTIYTWAVSHGYSFANAGLCGSTGTGSTSQPVTTVNWRDCIVWCNAASEYEGLTPVYTYLSVVIRDSTDANATACDNAVQESANGYRLPTSDEWYQAARYPSTPDDYLSGASANYEDKAACDAVAVYGLYWDGDSWESTGVTETAVVGTKSANGINAYDISGNILEWCFDWHSSFIGQRRVIRGGCYMVSSAWCQISYLSSIYVTTPDIEDFTAGFRLARTQ